MHDMLTNRRLGRFYGGIVGSPAKGACQGDRLGSHHICESCDSVCMLIKENINLYSHLEWFGSHDNLENELKDMENNSRLI